MPAGWKECPFRNAEFVCLPGYAGICARMLESALAKELSSILSHIPAYPGRHTNSALSRHAQLEKSAKKDQNGMPGTPVFSKVGKVMSVQRWKPTRTPFVAQVETYKNTF
jgi:hypothetical protein